MTSIIYTTKEQIAGLLKAAFQKALEAGDIKNTADLNEPFVELTKDRANGDFASNFCLTNSKKLCMNPRALADALQKHVDFSGSYIEKLEIAGPGFLNFFVKPCYFMDAMELVQKSGQDFGSIPDGNGVKVLVEFVSANPTGPMHLGNARGGVLGDTLASLLSKAGYDVSREFYVNDAGNQVALFGKSLKARYLQHFKGEDAIPFPDDGYHGDDIKETAEAFIALHGDAYAEDCGEAAVQEMIAFGLERNLQKMKTDLAQYKVTYDTWFLESSLHKSGAAKRTVQMLEKNGYTYTLDGATWLRLSDFYEEASALSEEEKREYDEVLVRSNGFFTYFAVDLAYHLNKFTERNFDIAIDILGADHHGHTLRFAKALTPIGVQTERLEFVLMQLVRLLRGGEMVRMSKRTGKAITLSNLLEEISVDAARFFFNSRASNTHLEFDLDLAVREDSENPVYYVQYAHARIMTLLSKMAEEGKPLPAFDKSLFASLETPEELALMQMINTFPEEIRQGAKEREPARLTRYSIDVASCFHSFYNACNIKNSPPELFAPRMLLTKITGDLLKNILDMLKITAPERM